MKRRWISLLAIVALLISMMTCVVIPSTAADTTGSEATSGKVTPTVKQIAKAFYDTINWSGNDDLKQDFVDLYSGNAEKGIAIDYEKAIQLVDNGLAGKDLEGNDLTTPLTWKNFNGTTNPYPRFLCHEAFEARGYDGLNWTIAAKEDWYEMDDVAMTANPANSDYFDATGTKYFEGVTFHLKATVDFGSADIMPLGAFRGRLFSGTIDGHGYGFANINMYLTKTEVIKDSKYYSEYASYEPVAGEWQESGALDMSVGLIGYMGSCTIRNFGMDSGYITLQSANKGASVSTFGSVPAGATSAENPIVFENVWSSSWLFTANNAAVSGLYGSVGNSPYAVYAKVNGAVLDGTYLKQDMQNYPNISGVVGNYSVATATGGEFSNIIFSGDVAFVTDSRSTLAKMQSYNPVNVKDGDGKVLAWDCINMFMLDEEASFDANNFKNVYGVTGENKVAASYVVRVGKPVAGVNSKSLLTDMSAEEVAWTINQKPTEENPVYFTLNAAGKIRPTSNAAEKLVKVTVNTGDTLRAVYVAPDGTANLKEKLGYKSDITLTSANGCEIDGVSVKVGTVDAVVTLVAGCEHTDMVYVPDAQNNRHTAVCELCGHQVDEACNGGEYAPYEDPEHVVSHAFTCVDCPNIVIQACDLKYVETKDGYKYTCAICGRCDDAPAPKLAGDADENGTVNLIDAIAILKKVVQRGLVNRDTSDINQDGVVDTKDVPKIIKRALGDKKVKEEFKPLEERLNGNYYGNTDLVEIQEGNLTMAGAEDNNTRYLRTNNISVHEGDTIAFGPVRKAQAVLGHFYDANGNSIELININNGKLDIQSTFKATILEKTYDKDNPNSKKVDETTVDGMVMVSITAPEGAKSVRLQLNANDEDLYYIRVNNEFTVADYQCKVNVDVDALDNPMKGQLFLTIGDSLCSATNDTLPGGGQRGWASRIKRNFGAEVINSSQGGSAISTVSLNGEVDDEYLTGETATDRQWIVSQVLEHTGNYNFDYILLEGGGNDANYGAPLGEMSAEDNFDPANFDATSTLAGSMERMIYNTIRDHGDTVAIGYMTIYNAPYYLKSGVNRFANMAEYFAVTKAICAKWKIPCLDLNKILTADKFDAKIKYDPDVDTVPSDYDTNSGRYSKTGLTMDGIHANGPGYDAMQKYIDSFAYGIESEENDNAVMKPVDQEIYLEVQRIEANKAAATN